MAKKPNNVTLKSFLQDIATLIGSGAMIRFSFPSDGGTPSVSCITQTSQFFSEFPFEVKGNLDEIETFQIPLEGLMAAATTGSIKNPAELTVKENSMVVQTKRARLEIATEPVPEALSAAPSVAEPLAEIAVSSSFKDMLKEVLPVLGMEKIHEAQSDFRLYCRLSKKSVFLACYSSQQVAFCSVANEFGVLGEFNVPYPAFSTFLKVVPPDTALTFGEDRMLATSGAFTLLQLVTPLSGKEPPGEVVYSKTIDISQSHESAAYVAVSKASIEEFLASCKGIVTDDSAVLFTVEGTDLNLKIETTASAVDFRIRKVDATLEEPFALELRLLKNIVSKVGDELKLNYMDGLLLVQSGAFGMITTTHATD